MQRDIDEGEELLLKWADWMRRGGGNVPGYPRKSTGFIPSWIKDEDDEQDAVNNYEFGKLNAAVDSLIQAHQRVIYKRHDLGFKVWSFGDEEALYLAAKEKFRVLYFGKNSACIR